MAFPTLPSYIAADAGRYHRVYHDMAPCRSSSAMSIPGLEAVHDAPPPLPPPRFPLYDAPPPQPEDRTTGGRVGVCASSFASGYGSMDSPCLDDRPIAAGRIPANAAAGDEGYASYVTTERLRKRLHPDVGLRLSQLPPVNPADSYLDTMKRKLDHARPFDKSSPLSLLTSPFGDLPRRQAERGLSAGKPLQLPIHGVLNRRHPDTTDSDTSSPRARPRRNNSDDATSRGSFYDFAGPDDIDMDDAHASAGQKRRAASPAHEMMLNGVSGYGDGVRRRDMVPRGSPTLRLGTACQPSPVSSLPPAVLSRSSSLVPSASMFSAGITPANSFGRRSPGGISPTSCSSPYTTPAASLTHSPRGSMSARAPGHGRAPSGNSPRKLDMHKPAGAKLQDFFMCDCCPKKPKKFPTAEELSAHEAEKQHECCYCRNRFKNKNEAERHQNSLHVRRHSWSCSALSGYDRAFHDSTSRPGEYDTCGYCGDEFPRSGRGPGSGALNGGIIPRHVTDLDWDDRIRHLQGVHKFRECNAAKKFYRADHFRQHLKHSHAGTSGKWTNMLENACMMEEDAVSR